MRLLNVSPAKNVLEAVFSDVMSSSVITSDEREQIQNVLFNSYLDDDEYAIINRLVYHVRRGWVTVIE
ncbi:hypothetical protein AFK68_11150 [Hydrocoleum sp. CS-953]|uniref:hypothetical protein n=1 Tax=Hydrocoleum sp. CS-953 TaxID=1671698 RepID=UPI000B9BAF7C|nr:hypothetical protein [Hydrocoleum sp. CS-953]OZH54405.1 hypothetical protein AFK68_11150 [Hydrocoleum sp. CS-953]